MLQASHDHLTTVHIHRKKAVTYHENISTWKSSKRQDSEYHQQKSTTSTNENKKVTMINAYEPLAIKRPSSAPAIRTYVEIDINFT